MRAIVAILGCAAILAAACGDRTPAEPSARRGDFWAALQTDADWEYFDTLRSLWEITDVTIIGRIVLVSEGRTLGGRRGERGTQATALVQVEVEEVVSGELAPDSDTVADVEIWRADSVPIEVVAAEAPDQPMLFLLQDVAGQPQPREVDDSAVVRDPGKTLYTIPTPKALFIERDDDVVTPLDPHPGLYEESIKATTLPGLADEIRSF